MCGIAGVIFFNNTKADAAVVRKMTDALAHRGPNAEGIYTDGSVGLGHRRLSIIDVSEASNQPFSDASGNYKVVFNGELYNYSEVKNEVKHISFKTTGDTEVLTELFSREGISCLRHFKGMFAFAVWDKNKQELTLVRDRMGVKPLYYYIDDYCCVFASEIRAILASGLVAPRINKFAINELLSYQSISSPDTIIEGINQLESGHYIQIKNASVKTGCYWDITERSEEFDYSSLHTIKSNLRSRLQDAVSSRLVSDVPVGAFLSGGIDSSAVVALMANASNTAPNTFTVAFTEKEFDESAFARIIAKKYKTNHTEILLKPTALLDELSNALKAMDTPSGDGINTFVVSQAVKRSGISVALSGIGGDELFGGYPFFKQFRKISDSKKLWEGTGFLRSMAASLLNSSGNRKMGRFGQLIGISSSKIEHAYPVFRRILTPSHLAGLLSNDHLTETNIERYLKQHAVRMQQFPSYSQVSIAEFSGYTQHTLLKDTDQMGMAHALEIREPFFDHELVSYVLGIPDQYKMGTFPKSLLVDSLGEMLPDSIVHRPKQGFVFPWNVWMKGPLRQFCELRIQNLSERNIVNGDALKRHWAGFLRNDPAIRWIEIWLFVILENWLEENT